MHIRAITSGNRKTSLQEHQPAIHQELDGGQELCTYLSSPCLVEHPGFMKGSHFKPSPLAQETEAGRHTNICPSVTGTNLVALAFEAPSVGHTGDIQTSLFKIFHQQS